MDWEREYSAWREALGRRGGAPHRAIEAARGRRRDNDSPGWRWLVEALEHDENRWFVAALFERHPVPRKLFSAFMRAAVHELDASRDRTFVEPCVRSHGAASVARALVRYVEHGTP